MSKSPGVNKYFAAVWEAHVVSFGEGGFRFKLQAHGKRVRSRACQNLALQDSQRESEAAAQRAQSGLKRKLEQVQEKLDLVTGEKDKLSTDLAAVQAALAKKVLEMNDAIHEAKQRHEEEVTSLQTRYKRDTEETETTHCRRIAALKVRAASLAVLSSSQSA